MVAARDNRPSNACKMSLQYKLLKKGLTAMYKCIFARNHLKCSVPNSPNYLAVTRNHHFVIKNV